MINRKLHFVLLALFALFAPTSYAASADKLRISYSAVILENFGKEYPNPPGATPRSSPTAQSSNV